MLPQCAYAADISRQLFLDKNHIGRIKLSFKNLDADGR